MDIEDQACVYWRGGDSSAWPDNAWRRRTVITLMVLGLLGSMTLHAVIGWPDALGALTFAQRLVGILFLLAAAEQGIATLAVVDHWGKRQLTFSGSLVFLGVLIALATSSLLLFLWLQERELVLGFFAFLSLWLWSLWALCVLIREKVWQQIPYPRKFALGVTVTAILTAVSLGYSTLYQPTSTPMHITLQVQFGNPETGPDLPYVLVPLRLYAKNNGGVPAIVLVDDYTVYGRAAKFSAAGQKMKEWKKGWEDDWWGLEAGSYESDVKKTRIKSGQFQGPGSTLAPGEEFRKEAMVKFPKKADYETLEARLQLAFLRHDRGKNDGGFYSPKASWLKGEADYYCPPEECIEQLIYHGVVRHNNNLINVTRKPRYVVAFWSPEEEPDALVSSFSFKERQKGESIYDVYGNLEELETERSRYDLGWVAVSSAVPVQGMLNKSKS
ncbi:Yip1 family protein [Streptomyces thermolilacinus]|uniref:Yip1 family protein n=1 Tax=Streptomyces thermolilacinus TaxID=285540 RepID=UPI001374729F|nr:Yip1 family protein [Streptomyces thermolilacinus]